VSSNSVARLLVLQLQPHMSWPPPFCLLECRATAPKIHMTVENRKKPTANMV